MSQKLLLLGAAGGVGTAAFVAFRLSIRAEVLRALNEDYNYDKSIANDPLYRLGAQYLNVPTARELSDSLVPLWSFTLPEKALEDVLANGRASHYWPANRRVSKAPKLVDEAVFTVLRRLYYENTQKSIPAK